MWCLESRIKEMAGKQRASFAEMKGLFAAFLLFAVATVGVAESVHWQWRDLVCTTKNGVGNDKLSGEPAECTIQLRENEKDTNSRPAPLKNAGCFDEVVNGTTRTYCDLLCPNADTVYLIKRDPQVHRSCFVFYTHRLERRGDDWFLWRDKNCRLSQIKFTIRCEFLFPRAEFPSDTDVFQRLRKRTQRLL